MWRQEHSETTAAPAEAVWRLWSDVGSWPTWDASVASADLEGRFEAGSRGTLTPAGSRTVAFSVTDARPERAFAIEMRLPLARLRFEHELEGDGHASRRIIHRVTLAGPLAPLWARIVGRGIAEHLPQAVRRLARLAEQEEGTEAGHRGERERTP